MASSDNIEDILFSEIEFPNEEPQISTEQFSLDDTIFTLEDLPDPMQLVQGQVEEVRNEQNDILELAISETLNDVMDLPKFEITVTTEADGRVNVSEPQPSQKTPTQPENVQKEQEQMRKIPYFLSKEREILKASIEVGTIKQLNKTIKVNQEIKEIYEKYKEEYGMTKAQFVSKVRNMINASKRKPGKFKRTRGFTKEEQEILEKVFERKFNSGQPLTNFSAKKLTELSENNDGIKKIIENFSDMNIKKLFHKIRLCFTSRKK